MTINLPSIFDRNYRLGLLEMVFQDIKISKFPGEACLQTPLVKSRFGEVLTLDCLKYFQTSKNFTKGELFNHRTTTAQVVDQGYKLVQISDDVIYGPPWWK